MKKENVIKIKSYEFALNIIKLTRSLETDIASSVIIKQLIRSGTSIGANVEEAIGGASKKDFIHKMTISHKEARESNCWLRLLKDSGSLKSALADPLITQSEELIKILFVIIRNSRANEA